MANQKTAKTLETLKELFSSRSNDCAFKNKENLEHEYRKRCHDICKTHYVRLENLEKWYVRKLHEIAVQEQENELST